MLNVLFLATNSYLQNDYYLLYRLFLLEGETIKCNKLLFHRYKLSGFSVLSVSAETFDTAVSVNLHLRRTEYI